MSAAANSHNRGATGRRVAAASATALAASGVAATASAAVSAFSAAPTLRLRSGSQANVAAQTSPGLDATSHKGSVSGVQVAMAATVAAVGCRQALRRGGLRSSAGPAQRSSTALAARGGSSAAPTLHVGIVGYGLVGKELVGQLLDKAAQLEADLGAKVQIAGVARSSTMVLCSGADSSAAFAGGAWPAASEEAADLGKLAKHLLDAAAASGPGSRALIVDNTASDAPAELYESWLSQGIFVVTPNKRAGSGPYDRYERIMAAARSGNCRFLYEATVGAGLPIINPLQGLVAAGDEVKNVEGIFSGTLSYIFNTWKPGQKFSEVVAIAKDKGFTEPDPRDDLSGTDVARKVTILARELGLKIELADVPVESLVPAKLQDWQPEGGANLGDAFVKELEAYDDEMGKLIEDAEASGQVLRFVGSVDVATGAASVKLGKFPKDHPFASTQFADNIVAFDTKWYDPRPLVVQGPGAGAAVTAAGVFGNVYEVLKGL